MSAIAALWRFDGRPDAAEGCARMLAAQQMYGPDASANWSSGDVAVGRQLMRMLPEDVFDHQPLVGGGGRFVLVADLRLDNRDELAESLRLPTASARLLCDAAILLAAIERWEDNCLSHLVGDYAFVLWDGARRRLLMARDPLGERPLHYHRGSGFCAVASMPKGLHALPEVPYAPDEDRIEEFLAMIPEFGAQSFFRRIERVEPGHAVAVTSSDCTTWRHWQPRRAHVKLRGPDEYSEALRDLLDRAVRCRLRGAGDVAAQLSGGFDSSAVAATAARLLGPLGHRVFAFTSVPREGYEGPCPPHRIIDEGPYAAATAAMYPNISHVLVRSPGRSPLAGLDSGFLLFERPIANICNYVWLSSINDAARERKLDVMLVGDRGNLGLSYDGLAVVPDLFRDRRLIAWWRQARALVMRRQMRWRGVMALTLGQSLSPVVWNWLNRVMRGTGVADDSYFGIHPHRLAALKREGRMDYDDPSNDSFSLRLSVLREADFGNWNTGILGGWHIDMRDPTADVRLLEFCLAVPPDQFLHEGIPKALARRTLADRVPKLVLDERRRGLQAADWHEQLTAVRDCVAAEIERLGACEPAAKVIDLPRLRRLVENWPSEGWESEELVSAYRFALLHAISAGYFLRRTTGH
jgi:asparagine synthase (glutamine-hydrolysing)